MPNATGPQLRKERLTAELKANAKVPVTVIAKRMGVSRQTVHDIERAAEPKRADEYREAWMAELAVKVAARDTAA